MATFAFTVEAINRVHEALSADDKEMADAAETMLSAVVLNLRRRSFLVPEQAEESWEKLKCNKKR